MQDKDVYIQKFQTQLDEWGVEITKLKARAAEAAADAQVELNKQLENLQARQTETNSKFEAFKHHSGEALESLKVSLESARDAMSLAFQDARSKFHS